METERYRMEKSREEGNSTRYNGDALCPYKNPKFETGLVKSLKREEQVWKMKAKNKRKREMEKCGEEEKKQQIQRRCFVPIQEAKI
jgi:hypothetical protein